MLNVAKSREIVAFEGVKGDTNGKWVRAKDLTPTDKLLLSDGKYAIITAIEAEELPEPQTTYNLEIEDFHTYYVGEQRVCVHNNNCNVIKDGDYKSIVNTTNESEAPHAHILKNGSRIAKVDANGIIVSGSQEKGVVRFVTKHKKEIIKSIADFYPRRLI